MKNYCIIPFFRGIKAFFSFYQQIPLAMKLFIFILCFFVGTVYSADSYSQSVSMNAKSQTVKSVLNEIEKQAGVSFFINNKNIDLERKVSISASNSKIDKILSTLFSGTNVRYHIIGDQVILSSKEEKENVSSLNSAQQKTVTIKGLVTDPDGNPLIGVSVMQSGTSNGAITDIDGRYSIKAPVGSKLVYSYVGFVTDEKIIKAGMTTINIRLLESSESLEEVVVVGFGQQKKESMVASVNSIGTTELKSPSRSLTNSLAGQISGVIAVQRSGEPGHDDSDFYIRGMNSFQSNVPNTPLVLVDGVPRAMKDIEPDEIETLTVLKDASATAVYGAEGANGVVLITSKRGVAQKPRLSVRLENGFISPTCLPETLGSYDWATMYNEAAWNDAGNPSLDNYVYPYSTEVLNHYLTGDDPDMYPDADFLGMLNKHTTNQRVTLNLRGGAERVRYFVSGSYYHESGIFDSQSEKKYDANIGYSRYNIRSNIDMDLTKTTKLSVDISGQYASRQQPGGSTDRIFRDLFRYAPNVFPLIYSDGTLSEHPDFNNYDGEAGINNPYNLLNNHGYSKTWSAAIQSGIVLDQKLDFITKGLSIRLKGSFDADFNATSKRVFDATTYIMKENENGERTYEKKYAGEDRLKQISANGTAATKKIYIEASVNYMRTFAGKHDVTAMLLYNQKETQSGSTPLAYRKQGVVGRASYAYDKRYSIETSFGMTGSENFAKNHRWGIFPSVGGAWFVSHEKFFEPLLDVVNKLKLRASIGLTGYDKTATRFPYRGTISTGGAGYNFGFVPGYGNATSGGGESHGSGAGVFEGLFEAPYLSWEVETKRNIGIDLGFLRGQVDLSVDYFKNSRKDILMARKTVSGTPGFRQMPWQNFGKMENQGFDGNITVKQNINKLMLTFRGNVTYAHNKVLEYDEVNPAYDYQRYTGNILNKPLLYIADGLYTPDDFDITTNADGSSNYTLKEGLAKPSSIVRPGDIKYRDLNGDKEINNYDRTYNHEFYSPTPEWVYGFGLNAEFKGFYASCFFQGSANTAVNLNAVPSSFNPNQSIVSGPIRRQVLTDHWNPAEPYNQSVLWPRLHSSVFSHNNELSTWWYRKGDYLRLKNVEFGYHFDKKMLRKAKIQSARLYVQGSNLCVWDNIKMWDPELGNANSGAKYPLNRTWMVGVELGF